MHLLAFDTSTAQGSVALLEGERVLTERTWRRQQSHSEFLTQEIEDTLKEAGLTPASLDALAVGQGPGSFTGIRVAINAARALAYALKKPVYVRDTSSILVEPITRNEPVLTIINAQKNTFFVSKFHHGLRKTPLEFKTLEEVQEILNGPHLCVGDGCELIEPSLSPAARLNFIRDNSISDYALATSLGRLTISQHDQHPPLVWNLVQPLYLRASGAEEKLIRAQKN